MIAHSILFVPGSRPDRFAAALASAAHLVCIDLEDAVEPNSKPGARRTVIDFLREAPLDRLAIRINCVRTRSGLADILALTETAFRPHLVVIPKVEAAAELSVAAGALEDAPTGFIPMIESATGLANAGDIARASRCEGVAFGGVDFAADLGVPISWDALLSARSSIVHACARAGVPAFDAPYIDINHAAGLEEDVIRVKALGFAGKVVIHPRQVDVVNRAFRPTAEEVAEAEAAIAAFGASNGAAVQFQGRLLETPIVRRYQRILEAARASRSDS